MPVLPFWVVVFVVLLSNCCESVSYPSRLVLGYDHSCYLQDDGQVFCFGWNHSGQLGDKTTVARPFPVQMLGITMASQISAGGHFTCFVDQNIARCTGWNWFGELGDGTKTDRAFRVSVRNLPATVVRISCGSYHACAILRSGALYCWGYNLNGELGIGKVKDPRFPQLVPLPALSVEDIATGGDHTCVLLSDSLEVYCTGKIVQAYVLTRVTIPAPVQRLSSGFAHACALTVEAQVYCWGRGVEGQLGNGSPLGADVIFPPTVVAGLVDVKITSVSCGSFFTCVLNSKGQGNCFGQGLEGQLGTRLRQNEFEPPVLWMSSQTVGEWTEISGGRNHTCMVSVGVSGPLLECVGSGTRAQLGNGALESSLNIVRVQPYTFTRSPTSQLPTRLPTQFPSKSPFTPTQYPTKSPKMPTQFPSSSPGIDVI